MSASEHLSRQFQQLDMLRPARDLMDPSKTMSALFPGRAVASNPARLQERWDFVRQEAHGPRAGSGRGTLREHIQAHGIKTPVELRENHPAHVAAGLGADTLLDGHHRTVVAHDISPEYLVPVKHFSTGNHVR
jgi:hypothetical protein